MNEYTEEEIKDLEKEFKEFLILKEEMISGWHDDINYFLSGLEGTPVLIYTNEGPYIRAELHYDDGRAHYSTYETQDIVVFSLIGTTMGMFSFEGIGAWAGPLLMGADIGWMFIETVNEMISMIQDVSEHWDICIK